MEPIAQSSAVDQLIEVLRTEIVRGRLAPGSELNATHLARSMQVSHIPIREALRALEREGLVTLHPRKRARVAEVNVGDVHDVYRLRMLFEGSLVEQAAHAYSDEHLGEIERLYSAMGSTSSDADLAAHDAFHRALVTPVATDWDLRILNVLWNASERHLRVLFAAFEPGDAQYEHEHFLDHARNRDGSAMRQELTSHLTRGLDLLTQRAANAVAQTPPAPPGAYTKGQLLP